MTQATVKVLEITEKEYKKLKRRRTRGAKGFLLLHGVNGKFYKTSDTGMAAVRRMAELDKKIRHGETDNLSDNEQLTLFDV